MLSSFGFPLPVTGLHRHPVPPVAGWGCCLSGVLVKGLSVRVSVRAGLITRHPFLWGVLSFGRSVVGVGRSVVRLSSAGSHGYVLQFT